VGKGLRTYFGSTCGTTLSNQSYEGRVALVNSAIGLYQRYRHMIPELLKFGVIGGVGFVVTLGGADLLHFDAHLNKYVAVTIATIVATVVTFLGNRHWTFKDRSGSGATRESIVFFILNGVGLLIQYACIWFFLDALSLSNHPWFNIANLVGVVLGTIFRFFSYRQWVWKAPLADAIEGHEELEPAGAVTPAPGPATGPSAESAERP
jgi:putative flippase GtrA